MKELLAPHGLTPNDCCFAVHTGGPKILEKTAAALGVDADSMQVAYYTPFKRPLTVLCQVSTSCGSEEDPVSV